MKSYLITGLAGSGKTTISKTLSQLGYESYDIETIPNLFNMYRIDTGEPFTDYDNADLEKAKNSDWRCDPHLLKQVLANQKNEIAFYCGIASNIDDIIHLFTKTFVLSASEQNTRRRLKSREGTDDFGNTKETQDLVISWKEWFEEDMQSKGAIIINANPNPQEVVQTILSNIFEEPEDSILKID